MPPAQRICEAEWIGPRGNALPGPIFTFPKRHAKHGDTHLALTRHLPIT